MPRPMPAAAEGGEKAAAQPRSLDALYEAAWLASPDYNADWEGGRAPEWHELTGDLALYRDPIIRTVDALLPAVRAGMEELAAQAIALARWRREGSDQTEVVIYTDDDLDAARAVIAALARAGAHP